MFKGIPVNVTVRVTVIHFVAVREMSEVRTNYVVKIMHTFPVLFITNSRNFVKFLRHKKEVDRLKISVKIKVFTLIARLLFECRSIIGFVFLSYTTGQENSSSRSHPIM